MHQRWSKTCCITIRLLLIFIRALQLFNIINYFKERGERETKERYEEINYREEATSDYWNLPQVKICHWIDFSGNRGWTCMPWLINVLCFLPYLNPRPSHISQEQIERGTDTGLTIKTKVIRNHWKTFHKRQWVRHIQYTLWKLHRHKQNHRLYADKAGRPQEYSGWKERQGSFHQIYYEFTMLQVCKFW